MTEPSSQIQEFVLSLDVAKRWWLRHLPYSGEALRFLLETIASHAAYFIGVEDLLSDVLREFADDLGEDLDAFLAQQVGLDARTLFADLESGQLLRVVPRAPLLRRALLVCAQYHVSFDDALAVSLAEQSGSPLVIADPALFEILQVVERSGSNLHVVLLGDLLSG